MAWSIGSLTLGAGEQPNEGDIEFVQQQRWSRFKPIGYTGDILTYLGTDAREHRVHITCSETTKDSLKTIYDARTAVTFIGPWAPFIVGVSVLILSCTSRKNRSVAGAARWDTWITMVEQ